jgi:hypothetical protein
VSYFDSSSKSRISVHKRRADHKKPFTNRQRRRDKITFGFDVRLQLKKSENSLKERGGERLARFIHSQTQQNNSVLPHTKKIESSPQFVTKTKVAIPPISSAAPHAALNNS